MQLYHLLGLLLLQATAFAAPKRANLEKFPRTPDAVQQHDTRLIGGEPVNTHGLAPYLVSLSTSALVYAHACAGTIIGKEWVLTAAHCLADIEGKSRSDLIGLPIYAGLQDRNHLQSAQVRRIDYAYAHKQFNASDESSPDIALLHVAPPFHFNANVSSVVLPYRQEDYSNKSTAIVSYGWGLTDPAVEEYVKQLQLVRTQVLKRSECRAQLPVDSPLGRNQICAFASVCFGDGGSPLVYENEGGNGRNGAGRVIELIGITSWGYLPCGYKRRPTVYTEVAQHIDWIAQVQWAYYIMN